MSYARGLRSTRNIHWIHRPDRGNENFNYPNVHGMKRAWRSSGRRLRSARVLARLEVKATRGSQEHAAQLVLLHGTGYKTRMAADSAYDRTISEQKNNNAPDITTLASTTVAVYLRSRSRTCLRS